MSKSRRPSKPQKATDSQQDCASFVSAVKPTYNRASFDRLVAAHEKELEAKTNVLHKLEDLKMGKDHTTSRLRQLEQEINEAKALLKKLDQLFAEASEELKLKLERLS